MQPNYTPSGVGDPPQAPRTSDSQPFQWTHPATPSSTGWLTRGEPSSALPSLGRERTSDDSRPTAGPAPPRPIGDDSDDDEPPFQGSERFGDDTQPQHAPRFSGVWHAADLFTITDGHSTYPQYASWLHVPYEAARSDRSAGHRAAPPSSPHTTFKYLQVETEGTRPGAIAPDGSALVLQPLDAGAPAVLRVRQTCAVAPLPAEKWARIDDIHGGVSRVVRVGDIVRLRQIDLPASPAPRAYLQERQRHFDLLAAIARFIPYQSGAMAEAPPCAPSPAGEELRGGPRETAAYRIFFGQLPRTLSLDSLHSLVRAASGVNLIIRHPDKAQNVANGFANTASECDVVVDAMGSRIVFDVDGAWQAMDDPDAREIFRRYNPTCRDQTGPNRALVVERQHTSDRQTRRPARSPFGRENDFPGSFSAGSRPFSHPHGL